MYWPFYLESNDSDLFYVEQSSGELSPPPPNTPIVLNSTETSVSNSPVYDNISIFCVARATNFTIEGINDALWMWTPAAEYFTLLERFDQPVQYFGNNGSSTPYSRRAWQKSQPPVTGAVGPVSDIHTPEEPQYDRRLENSANYDRR